MKALHLKSSIALAAILTVLLIGWEDALSAPPSIRGRALLVGCTKYDYLEPSLHLQGPVNDVALMRDLLCQRFGFMPERVVTLAESAGQPRLRPTRANIEREFHRLGREAEAGEQIVIFLAGHGSQQPDLDSSIDDPEPDGLDELFLPADVKAWEGGIARVPNAIVDDEFRIWLREIEKHRAVVTMIVDSCHAGGMTRGIDERVRQIPATVLLPSEVIDKARSRALGGRVRGANGQTHDGRTHELALDNPSVIAIYAAQSSESTVEQLLPLNGPDRKPHGLLTYTMNQVISRSTRPLTYRELVRQIQTQYLAAGRSFPTPMIEGQNRDRELFGMTEWLDLSRIYLIKSPRGWTINAGMLQGVTPGSVLAVFTNDASSEGKPLGHVRVQVSRTVNADVVPCEFEGQAATNDLPERGRCEIAFLDAGDLRLRVAISTQDPVANDAFINQLKLSLASGGHAGQRPRLVQLVDKPSDADWIIRIRNQDALVIPAEAAASDWEILPPVGFGPRPMDDSTIEWLRSALERIARAANLKKLAAMESVDVPRGDALRIELNLESDNRPAPKGSVERLTLRDGEQITIHLKNPCRFAVDVTLLSIDMDQGIAAIFPAQGEINRLQPGDSVPFKTMVVAKSRGLEHLVAIAVKADREVVDFTSLAQPSLETTKTRGGSSNRGLDSSLGELLKNAVFAEGSTRGIKPVANKVHRLQLLTWEVEPNPEPSR